jgi:probable HAF family extracellular repeat protein
MRRFCVILNLCSALLIAQAALAQSYTVTDLGTLGGTYSIAYGMNASGQVVGQSLTSTNYFHAFRTAANSAINPATDDLGTLGAGGSTSDAQGINDLGQVVGLSSLNSDTANHAFRTAANSPINPATDDLGTLGGTYGIGFGINSSGQVVGYSRTTGGLLHAFRTAANSVINPAADDLGTLGGSQSLANSINGSGQIVGWSTTAAATHAFRTAANSPINAAADDLGTLGGVSSAGQAINASGQVVGYAYTSGNVFYHAFRTAANSPIIPATDDLGTLGGSFSYAQAINGSGQVVGWADTTGDAAQHAFSYSGGVITDLNTLIPSGSGWELQNATAINDAGQIAGYGIINGEQHAFRLKPVGAYLAGVQQPINPDGSSVFNASKGVVPAKFTLKQNNAATCALPPATIAVTRTAGGTLGAIDESTYTSAADSGSNFRIDPTACQYIYNVAAKALGIGVYSVDIKISGNTVGNGVFALK